MSWKTTRLISISGEILNSMVFSSTTVVRVSDVFVGQ